ncbi:hypothetical protein [Haloplanus natans]|uniref:hypothetical protein n=1 Tax=Haloplanus natans TaxID=376171 RepID=UPI0006783268|nr:hypothetical protein [Haloplanus natans]
MSHDSSLGAGASRPASLTVALAVGVGLIVAGVTGGAAAGVAATAAAGVGLGVATLCRAHDGPAATAVGSALTPVVALVGVAGVVRVAAERGGLDGLLGGEFAAVLPAVALAVGAGVAAFGATGTLGDGIGEVALRQVYRSAIVTATVIGLAFGAVLVARFDALDGLSTPAFAPGALLDPVLSPGGPTMSLVSFFGLVVAAALAGRWALSVLPVVELAPRARREAVGQVVDRLDADCRVAVKYGVVAASASLPTALPVVREALPVVAVAAFVASTGPRVVLLSLAAAAATLALAGRLLQAAAGDTAAALGRILPATVGGVGVVVVAVGTEDAVRGVVDGLPSAVRPVAVGLLDALSPTGLVLGVVVGALGALIAALTAFVVLLAVDLVPTRGSGGALAGTGLAACAVVLGLGAAPALATFVLVGLGVVAWDVSDRGVAARADLGPRSATSIEAVHVVGSVAVAAVGVGVAWVSLGLVGAVALPDGALLGAVAAVAAAVILLGVLRA